MQKIILKFPETGGGQRKRARGRPLKSTSSVRSKGDYAVFVFGNLSLFYVYDFSSVDYVAFFLNWIFLGGLLGLVFKFFVLDLGCVLVVYCMRVGRFDE